MQPAQRKQEVIITALLRHRRFLLLTCFLRLKTIRDTSQ